VKESDRRGKKKKAAKSKTAAKLAGEKSGAAVRGLQKKGGKGGRGREGKKSDDAITIQTVKEKREKTLSGREEKTRLNETSPCSEGQIASCRKKGKGGGQKRRERAFKEGKLLLWILEPMTKEREGSIVLRARGKENSSYLHEERKEECHSL